MIEIHTEPRPKPISLGISGDRLLLLLEAFKSLLVRPRLNGEIRLSVEADAKDHNSEERGYIAGKLPVLPLARLARRWWSSVEEVPVGPFLRAVARPPALPATMATTYARHGRPGSGPCHPHRRRRKRSRRSHREREESRVVNWGFDQFDE